MHVCKAGAELYEKVGMEIERGSVDFARVLRDEIDKAQGSADAQGCEQWLGGLKRAWNGWAERSVSSRTHTEEINFCLFG